MIDFFDNLGNMLNDMIGTTQNNNVGWAGKQIFGYAEGGEVEDPGSAAGLFHAVAGAAKNTMNRQDTSALGGNFVNSPTYMMQHFSQLGKFFNGAEPGNQYTNHYKPPEPSKPPQAADPNDFFAKWYMSMRKFSEAAEVADRGNVITRSK